MFSKLWDARTARILFTGLIFIAVLAFLRAASETLTLFLFAILFAYFVEPLVARLEPRLHGRIRSIAVVYLVVSGALVGLGFALGSRVGAEIRSLVASIPSLFNQLASGQLIRQIGTHQGWTQEHQEQIHQFFLSHRNQMLGYVQSGAASLAGPLSHLWWLILIPILGFFFLKDASSIASSLVRVGQGRAYRVTVQGVLTDVNDMLGSYIRAQLILAALTAVVLTIVLSLMHAPYSFALGPIAGACEFIPVVGPAVACVATWGIAALTGYSHLLWIFLFLGTWRVIQDYITAPRIMGGSLQISPLMEIFAVLAGGEIGGVVGALVSVPTVAILRILWQRLGADHSSIAALAQTPAHSVSGSGNAAVEPRLTPSPSTVSVGTMSTALNHGPQPTAAAAALIGDRV